MREDIKELLDLQKQETKVFNELQDNYDRNMNILDGQISEIRDNCEHVYGPAEINSFFGFKISKCTICGGSKVTG